MLGITGADAAVIITAIGAVLVAMIGKKHGDTAKKETPPDPVTSGIAAVFADKDLMTRNTLAMEDIARSIKEYCRIQTDEHERAVEDTLLRLQEGQDRLSAALLKKHDDDERADRTAGRVDRTIDRTVNRVESTLKKPRRD